MSLPPAPSILKAARNTQPGVIGQTVLKMLTQRAMVASVRSLSPAFRWISLRSESFRGLVWVPGDKMQIRVQGMAFRTFTPFRQKGVDDVLDLVGHVHGDAPGADWLWHLAPGDACNVMRPRRSLDLGALQQSTTFFGDETTLGLAVALCSNPLGDVDTHFLFEATDADDTRTAFGALGHAALRHTDFVERRPGDVHLAEVEERLSSQAVADRHRQYVLAGKASSIQRLHRALRRAGVKPSQMLVKAYWSPGKVGLD